MQNYVEGYMLSHQMLAGLPNTSSLLKVTFKAASKRLERI